jgi:hypothetical protein
MNKKDFGISLCLAIIIFLTVGFITPILFPMPDDVIMETMTLESQGFCDYCDGCYCLNGTFVSCTPIIEGNPYCYYELTKHPGQYREVFFADEFVTHPEWQKGDTLQIRWVETAAGWRIRGVTKI